MVNLDAGTWMWLQASVWVTVSLVIVWLVTLVYHLISEFRTPLESKGIRNCSHSHKSGALIANDDGNADFKTAYTTNSGEGYMETKPAGKWKWHWTGMFPRKGLVSQDITVSEGKDLEKTRTIAEMITELNTKKLHLRGARIPLWIGVESKGLLMSVYGVAGIQILEKFQAWFHTQYPSDVFPIDVHAVKQMVFKASYNESQINALASDHEHIGEERAKKGEGLNKLVLFAGIAFAALGLVALGIAAFIG